MSHPPKDKHSREVSGTKSLILGVRPSVRLPRRMVPSWVREPIGSPSPSLIASTPAMKVDATAPRPGIKMPSLPVAGATFTLDCFDNAKSLLGGHKPPAVHKRDGGVQISRSRASNMMRKNQMS